MKLLARIILLSIVICIFSRCTKKGDCELYIYCENSWSHTEYHSPDHWTNVTEEVCEENADDHCANKSTFTFNSITYNNDECDCNGIWEED